MTNADNIGPVNVAAAIARTTTTRGSVYGRRPVPVRESTTGSSSSHAPAYAMRKKNTSGCRDSTLRRASSGCAPSPEVVMSRLSSLGPEQQVVDLTSNGRGSSVGTGHTSRAADQPIVSRDDAAHDRACGRGRGRGRRTLRPEGTRTLRGLLDQRIMVGLPL